eukprot:Phypoly_transcript_14435.p1 GENE.Phypoly_transcript_14435~~Phypoly_transcript_14435.p1  ORF type:complete len:287 (+),score=40.09 Phypoly_transcript_14435:97-957(+)
MTTSFSVFSAGVIPIPEIQSFYSLDNITPPQEKRPYAWTMSVSTLDGYISFKDPGADGPKEVAMAHIKDSGSISDWRLLNGGWMFADAILGSGAIIRAEPDTKWVPSFDDMLEYRVNVLKKPKYPINIVVSGSGDIDLKHPMFHYPDLRSIIVTSKIGSERLAKSGTPVPPNTTIEVAAENPIFGDQEFKNLFQLFYEKYNIRFLDVTAGGVLIATFAKLKLLDEVRVTMAGQVCGAISSTGEKRPTLFQTTEPFSHENNPHLQFHKIAVFGVNHLFLRNLVKYRH